MNDEIISKIKKLRELSNSTNIHEAAAAAAAADKLILKFRISEQEINNHLDVEVLEDPRVLYESGRAITWKVRLAYLLADHYNCYCYNNCGASANGRKLTRITLAGVKSDIDIVHYMFNWLVFEVETLNKANKGKGHIYCNSFCTGAVNGICQQLKEAKEEQLKEAKQDGDSYIQAITKLDLRTEQGKSLVAAKFAAQNIEVKITNSKSNSILLRDPFYKGVEAGKGIHLGKSIGGKDTKLLGE